METKKKNIDWVLLLFLLLFTNQAIFSLKILGLVAVYLLRPNFRFGLTKGRMPLFIPLLILLSTFNYLFIIKDYSYQYTTAFIAGNMLWVFSFLSFHQVKLSVERYGTLTAHKTLKLFIVMHFIFCIGQLIRIMIITDSINPYVGLAFPYGMSTGDNVFGAFMENSLYNVTVSGFLTIYFIYKKNWFHATLASLCVILVFSNFGTIVFVGVMLGLLFTGIANTIVKRKVAWLNNIAPPANYALYIPFFIVLVVTVYATISPENSDYLVDKIKSKIFSIELEGKNNYRTMIADQKVDPLAFEDNSSEYLDKKVELYKKEGQTAYTSVIEKAEGETGKNKIELMREMTNAYVLKLQGKTLSVLETSAYLQSSTKHLLFGAGTTRFSSHIAQKMAGFDSSRLFMNILPRFRAQEYKENHMLLIEERVKSKKEFYSTANFPDSFYNQIFGEYGVLGALLFLIFYVGYFLKKLGRWSYGFWLFFILLPFAHLSYIFDTLCVMPFFEWLMLIDIDKEK